MFLSDSEIKKILLQDDIFPLGKFETVPVTHINDGMAESYPYVTLIKNNIDYESLLLEAEEHIKIVGFNYVKPRLSSLNSNINENSLRNVLEHVGFVKNSYQSFSLRKIGTNELEDWVMPKTKLFFNSLNVGTFRQQYAVAYPGWHTKLHRDHANFKIHGFRAMIPLSADVYMGYEDNSGNNLIYKLKRGGMYFVNIARMHRGFNESETKNRINLIFQMNSDKLIIDSKLIENLNETEIAFLPRYATHYEKWKFGYEL